MTADGTRYTRIEADDHMRPEVQVFLYKIGEALTAAGLDPSRELGIAMVLLGTGILTDFGTTAGERGQNAGET